MTIFVANFDSETEESDLRVLFENFGTVNDVHIVCDWRTGDPSGYAFIEMPFDGQAEEAIEKLDGRRWNGRRLKVKKNKSGVKSTDFVKQIRLWKQKQVVLRRLFSAPLVTR